MLTSLRGYKREIGLLKHVDSLIVLRKGRRQRPIGIFFVSFVLGSCRVYSPPTPPMSLKCPSTVSRELQSHHLISHSSCLCHLVAIIEASAMWLFFVLSCLPWQHVFFTLCQLCGGSITAITAKKRLHCHFHSTSSHPPTHLCHYCNMQLAVI